MIKIYFSKSESFKIVLIFLLIVCFTNQLKAQWVQIPDSNFRQAIAALVPSAIASDSMDTTNVQIILMDSINVASKNIFDLTGIQYFDSLKKLICKYNHLTALPSLPVSLTRLDCSNNQILNSLPALPGTLINLECSYNNINNLTPLPPSLFEFRISNNNLTSLPSLPASLNSLDVKNNSITSLPVLPSALFFLDARYNLLTSLPSLPTTISYLYVSYNHLTSLPTLPDSATWFHCTNNQLTSIPALPPLLAHFACDSNFLTALPTLPSNLSELWCSKNQITSLPSLPSHLFLLVCYQNQITSLPSLPSYLRYLECGYNQISVLPPLPNLSSLICEGNQLTSLPNPLPVNLGALNCSQNLLTSLPPLPHKLTVLNDSANNIPCLPLLPDTLKILHALNTGVTCLPNIPSGLTTCDVPAVLCSTGSSCFLYPWISGSAYRDDNLNNIHDAGEMGNRNFNIQIQPGNYLFHADDTGNYLHIVDTGAAYTISVLPVSYYNSFPANQSTPFMYFSSKDSLNDFSMQRIGIIHDLKSNITPHNSPRPGFSTSYTITIKNNGTVADTASLQFVFDPLLTYTSANPAPASVQGDTLTWNNIILVPGQMKNADVVVHVNNTIPLASNLLFYAAVSPFIPDTTPIDNADTLHQVVIGSFDPNLKSVLPDGDITIAQAAAGQWLDYTICFQNTGTASAINIDIKDSLSNNLKLSTFEFIASSHPVSWNINHRIADFKFDNINLLDSNANEPASHGFVRYRIKTENNLIGGSVINNTAYIYFDFNSAIVTNTTNTTVSFPSSIISSQTDESAIVLFSDPSSGKINVKCQIPCIFYEVHDLTGKLLDLRSRVESTDFSIDMNNFHSGIYFISFYVNDGKRIVKKISKMSNSNK